METRLIIALYVFAMFNLYLVFKSDVLSVVDKTALFAFALIIMFVGIRETIKKLQTSKTHKEVMSI